MSRFTPWSLVLGLVLVPAVAMGQDAPPETPPTEPVASPPTETPAVAVEAPAEPSPEETEARTRFRQGLVLARGGDCDAALAEFEVSYRLLPRPNTLFNMAQCEERLHRYDIAVQQYEEYLTVAPADAEDRDTVMATLESLRGLLGTIHVEVNVASDVWLGDRIVGVAPGDVLVPGGRHALELRSTGYLPERREVEVAARQRVELTVTLTTAETHIENTTIENTTIENTNVTVERPPVPLAVFATGVTLTALAAIGGLGAGINALVTHDTVAARDPRLPRDTSAIRDSALAADVLYVTAGVLAVGTLVLGILTDFTGAPTPEARSTESPDPPSGAIDDEEVSALESPGPSRAAVPNIYALPALTDTAGGVVLGGSF